MPPTDTAIPAPTWVRKNLNSWRVRWTLEHPAGRYEIDRDRRCRFHARVYDTAGRMKAETRPPRSFREAASWCSRA